MSTSQIVNGIEKLRGRENFLDWKFAVKTLLEFEGLWQCVEEEYDIDDDNEEDAAVVALKKQNDVKARTRIVLLVEPVIYVHVREAKSAREAWDNLNNAFDDSGLVRKVGLLRMLTSTTLQNSSSMEDYVNKILTTSHKLNSIGFEVSEEWVGAFLLSGLPERYEPLIMGIEGSGINITGDSIKSKLLQETKSESSDQAFYSGKNNKYYGKKNNRIRCYGCNKFGHICQNCPNKKSCDEHEETETMNSKSVFSAAYMAGCSNDWFIDSGASRHMTMNSHWCKNQRKPDIDEIIIANNKKLSVKATGSAVIKSEHCEINVKNVLLVPELSVNLLSVSQIVKNGNTVIFDKSNGCSIFNQHGEVICTANMLNGMYKLNLKSASALSASVGKFNCLNGGVCQPCFEEKQTRFPFKSNNNAANVWDLIHTDLCEPLEKDSLFFFENVFLANKNPNVLKVDLINKVNADEVRDKPDNYVVINERIQENLHSFNDAVFKVVDNNYGNVGLKFCDKDNNYLELLSNGASNNQDCESSALLNHSALNNETKSLLDNWVLEYYDTLNGTKPIESKWVFLKDRERVYKMLYSNVKMKHLAEVFQCEDLQINRDREKYFKWSTAMDIHMQNTICSSEGVKNKNN